MKLIHFRRGLKIGEKLVCEANTFAWCFSETMDDSEFYRLLIILKAFAEQTEDPLSKASFQEWCDAVAQAIAERTGGAFVN